MGKYKYEVVTVDVTYEEINKVTKEMMVKGWYLVPTIKSLESIKVKNKGNEEDAVILIFRKLE